jgi:hypothetical protein
MRWNDVQSPLRPLSAVIIVPILLANLASSSCSGSPMHSISMTKSDCGKVSFFEGVLNLSALAVAGRFRLPFFMSPSSDEPNQIQVRRDRRSAEYNPGTSRWRPGHSRFRQQCRRSCLSWLRHGSNGRYQERVGARRLS